MILGQVDGEDAIVAQRGDELFAVGAFSTHYHGTFSKAWLSVKPVRCPWQHACSVFVPARRSVLRSSTRLPIGVSKRRR